LNKKFKQKKQYQSGAITRLHNKQAEIGFKEPNPLKNYYGYAEDQQGKLRVVDAIDAKYRTEAIVLMEEECQLKGWNLVNVRAYLK
jgi:mRNA-degrading endonuclease HigB of HigAB toxin-antitoxin module